MILYVGIGMVLRDQKFCLILPKQRQVRGIYSTIQYKNNQFLELKFLKDLVLQQFIAENPFQKKKAFHVCMTNDVFTSYFKLYIIFTNIF